MVRDDIVRKGAGAVDAIFDSKNEGVGDRRGKAREHSYLSKFGWCRHEHQLPYCTFSSGRIETLTVLVPNTGRVLYHDKIEGGRYAVFRETENGRSGSRHGAVDEGQEYRLSRT